ncbi:MAG TPA: hypothetical protein VLS94_06525, partial [Fusibacter sp.]|nr:hypothetical protein [Fusibacter sp.]
MDNKNDDDDIVSPWDIQGNPYRTSLNPTMLSNDGLTERKVNAKLRESYHEPRKDVWVRYDREYVIRKIISDLISPLESAPVNVILVLVNDAIIRH